MPTLLPGALWRPVSYRREAGLFSTTPLGWVLHVQVGNGSLAAYFNNATSPNRKFSTAWVAKDGHGEQYTELTGKPWAQGDGNSTYWAFETEGFVDEPLTVAQITTLAKWHIFLKTPDMLALTPGHRGIMTHFAGGAAWGGHACPGTVRTAQRTTILDRVLVLRGTAPRKPQPPATPPAKPATASGGLTVQTLDFSHVTAASTTWVRGPAVRPLQLLLQVKPDGLGGLGTRAALYAAQSRAALKPDAVFGPATATALLAGR